MCMPLDRDAGGMFTGTGAVAAMVVPPVISNDRLHPSRCSVKISPHVRETKLRRLETRSILTGGMTRQLHPLAAGDAASVLPMMSRFYRHFGYPFSLRKQGAAFRRLLREPALGRAWRIEEGGVVAGYAILVFGWSIEYGGRIAMLDELFIEASHRDRGLGAWTLRRIRAAARKLGVRRLLLEVEADNLRGQALYRRLGYRDTRRRLLTSRP